MIENGRNKFIAWLFTRGYKRLKRWKYLRLDNMATTVDFIEYVCDQIAGSGDIRYKKMFGEYMVYVNEKTVLLVCDNIVFVKVLPCLNEIMKDAERGFPYDGAKEHYILDIDNSKLCKKVVSILEPNIPLPKLKKRKTVKHDDKARL
jgi:TfoX/Sxy family transcriptional regulator of competence genes